MAERVNCLNDCTAICCKNNGSVRVVFDFTEEEVGRLRMKGGAYEQDPEGGYIMRGQQCVMLSENKCKVHNQPDQPQCCKDNEAGDGLCLKIRRWVIGGVRYSEVE